MIKFKSFPVENDDIFMKIETNLIDSDLYRHNSLYNLKVDNNKRFVSTRDLGSNFFPSVTSVSLKSKDKLLTFYTGDRATGVGSYRPGEILIAVGRKNKYNDDKGLPDGVQDKNPIFLNFAIGFQDLRLLSQYNYHVH